MSSSPRRSPRISARESLEHQQKYNNISPTSSPLAGKTISRQKSRASTSALPSTSSPSSSFSNGKRQASSSPAEKVSKFARRAYSVGGSTAQQRKKAEMSTVPSRRNVPGPRKSAIRTLPPQEFPSPSELSPPPNVRTLFSRKSLGLEAFGGSDLMSLMESIGIIKPKKEEIVEPRKSEPILKPISEGAIGKQRESNPSEEDETIIRKKRRVTFNPFQEKANFEKNEPTMRIKPASEADLHPAPKGETSTSTASTTSSDMSLDEESESDQASSSSSESEHEVENQIDDGDDSEAEDEESESESAMDLTEVTGGVQDATMTRHSFTYEDEEDSNIDGSSVMDDLTVTMQLTEAHGGTQSEDEQEEDKVEELLEDDDESAMDLTDIVKEESPRMPLQSRQIPNVQTSPKRGHEHCKIPAAESPKPRVSATTMRVMARREASTSPIKAEKTGKIAFGGLTPKKSPFKSVSSPIKRESVEPTTPRKSRTGSPLPSPWHSPRASREHVQALVRKQDPKSPERRSKSPIMTPRRSSKASPFLESRQTVLTPGKSLSGITPIRLNARHFVAASPTKESWTMKKFFGLLDIGFIELTMPAKRRIEVKSEEEKGNNLRIACATIPSLDGLIDACRELQTSVQDGKLLLTELEKEFEVNPPSYVAEVLSMSDTIDRQKAISAFKLQKSAARAIALKAYYGWRTDKQFDDVALQELQTRQEKLQRDVEIAKQADKIIRQSSLPLLRQREAFLSNEISLAKSRHLGIAQWDLKEMQAMHEAMQEQHAVLEEQRLTYNEAKEQLDRLRARLSETKQRKLAVEEAIIEARETSKAINGSTQQEATRLALQIEHLQTLHMCNLSSANGDTIEFIIQDAILLVIQLDTLNGNVRSVNATNLQSNIISDFACKKLNRQLIALHPVEIIRQTSCIWTRVRQVLQLKAHLTARFPTEVSIIDGKVIISSAVLLKSFKAKIVIEMHCDLDLDQPILIASNIFCKQIYGISSTIASSIGKSIETFIVNQNSIGNLSSAISFALKQIA